MFSNIAGKRREEEYDLLFETILGLIDLGATDYPKTSSEMPRIKELAKEIGDLLGPAEADEPDTCFTIAQELDILKMNTEGTQNVGKAKVIVDELARIFAGQSRLPVKDLREKARELNALLNTTVEGAVDNEVETVG